MIWDELGTSMDQFIAREGSEIIYFYANAAARLKTPNKCMRSMQPLALHNRPHNVATGL